MILKIYYKFTGKLYYKIKRTKLQMHKLLVASKIQAIWIRTGSSQKALRKMWIFNSNYILKRRQEKSQTVFTVTKSIEIRGKLCMVKLWKIIPLICTFLIFNEMVAKTILYPIFNKV